MKASEIQGNKYSYGEMKWKIIHPTFFLITLFTKIHISIFNI
jgi:hypothetical protein